MINHQYKELIIIFSGAVLALVIGYLIGELIFQCIKCCVHHSPSSTNTRQQNNAATRSDLEGFAIIEIFSPRFLESARPEQREFIRTFVEELKAERDREGSRKLKLLPVKKYSSKENISTCSDCAICLQDFEEDDLCRVLVHCSHMFHSSCADEWLKTNQRCPLCRSDI